MSPAKKFLSKRILVVLAAGVVSFLAGVASNHRLFERSLEPSGARAEAVIPREPFVATPAPAADPPVVQVTIRPSTPAAAAVDPTATLPLPADFEPQAAMVLGCNDVIDQRPKTFLAVVKATWRSVRLIGVTMDAGEAALARQILAAAGLPADAVHFLPLGTQTPWARDWGPLFARRADGSVFLADRSMPMVAGWAIRRFEGDRHMPRRLAEKLGVEVVNVPLEVVGGNLLTNGEGLCVTTTQFAEINRRLRGLDQAGVAARLRKYLGLDRWVRLPKLRGEPTGHVDVFVTFTAPDVAVVARADPSRDPVNAARLDEAAAALEGLPTSRGPMRVFRVPMPRPDGNCWYSYTNVAFANDTVLVPVFAHADPAGQAEALALYRRLLPDRRIVPVPCDDLATARGLLHCITRGIPAFVPTGALARDSALAAE